MVERTDPTERAKLHHVVGAIMRDLARSRVAADVFSRNISRFYEQDSLLRVFPVPRTEISEVTIDLRFAIADAVLDERPMDAAAGKLVEGYAARIIEAAFDVLANAEEEAGWSEILESFRRHERSGLVVDLVDALEGALLEPLTDDEDLEKALLKHAGVVIGVLYSRLGEVVGDRKKQFRTAYTREGELSWARVRRYVDDKVEMLVRELSGALQVRGDAYQLAVAVTASELQDLPELAVSSLRITTRTRNYVWSQVDENEDGEPVRRLVAE